MKLTRILPVIALLWVIAVLPIDAAPKKIEVMTSLFPLYDFVRMIGQDKVNVTLLLPPGIEAHEFEPTPKTMLALNKANVFIYMGNYMEPWVEKVLQGLDNKKLIVIDASQGVQPMSGQDHIVVNSQKLEKDHGKKYDPHIWLDLSNAQKMISAIAKALGETDPSNDATYKKNAALYKAQLKALDVRFARELQVCPKKIFIHGGHYTFGYLARRYGLTCISAYDLSPNSEPGPKRLAEIIQAIKKHKLKYIFYEELLSPRTAEVLGRETGAHLLKLNATHNLTRDEFRKGVTFLMLMEENLKNLKQGLQ